MFTITSARIGAAYILLIYRCFSGFCYIFICTQNELIFICNVTTIRRNTIRDVYAQWPIPNLLILLHIHLYLFTITVSDEMETHLLYLNCDKVICYTLDVPNFNFHPDRWDSTPSALLKNMLIYFCNVVELVENQIIIIYLCSRRKVLNFNVRPSILNCTYQSKTSGNMFLNVVLKCN